MVNETTGIKSRRQRIEREKKNVVWSKKKTPTRRHIQISVNFIQYTKGIIFRICLAFVFSAFSLSFASAWFKKIYIIWNNQVSQPSKEDAYRHIMWTSHLKSLNKEKKVSILKQTKNAFRLWQIDRLWFDIDFILWSTVYTLFF